MKNRFSIFIILLLAIVMGIYVNNFFKQEVIDFQNFTEYYEENVEESGGWEVQSENFYIFTREYSLNGKKEIPKIKGQELPKKREYVVVAGDTFNKIAKAHGITPDVIAFINPKVNHKNLKIGQKLIIYNQNGIYYKVQKGDTLKKIGNLFRVKIEDIKEINNLKTNSLTKGQELFIKDPNLKRVLVRSGTGSVERIKASELGFIMPIRYTGISSPYGNRFHPVLKRYIFHSGVDLKAKFIPAYAAKEGVVTFAGFMNGYGKIIIIRHERGYETRYAHLDKIGVKSGDRVRQGELIGKTGQSGRVTGPHLHFELRVNGKTVNPMRYVSRK